VDRSGPSRKAIIGWTAGMLAALGLAWFVGAIGYPLVRNRLLVKQILGPPEHHWRTGPNTIETSAERSPHYQALTKLAEMQGKKPTDYVEYRWGMNPPHALSGRGVVVRSGGEEYVVAVMSLPYRFSHGPSVQQLVLMDGNGRILDKLVCKTRARGGELRTDVKGPPEADGAQVVIVFVPDKGLTCGHTYHDISHNGKAIRFRGGKGLVAVAWRNKGLCRLRIAGDRFEILFPEMKAGEKIQ